MPEINIIVDLPENTSLRVDKYIAKKRFLPEGR
jgi:hypothetical protein